MADYLFKGVAPFQAEPFTVKPLALPFADDKDDITYHPIKVVDGVDTEGTLKDFDRIEVSCSAPDHSRDVRHQINDGDYVARFKVEAGEGAVDVDHYRIYPAADFEAGAAEESGYFVADSAKAKKARAAAAKK